MESVAPEPNEAVVHVFSLEAPEPVCAEYEQLLSVDELARANRFLLPYLRRRYIICRGRLRSLLASATGISPADVRFQYESWGKPRLAKPQIPALHFNVSHCQDWALIALAHSPLGVDLELPNERINYRAIASQILSPSEQAVWDGLPASERDAAIMQLWVCKEALLKAMGLGIAEGLQQVSFPLPLPLNTEFVPQEIGASLQLHLDDDGTCSMNHWIDAEAWKMRMLTVVPQSYAAICTSPAVRKITVLVS